MGGEWWKKRRIDKKGKKGNREGCEEISRQKVKEGMVGRKWVRKEWGGMVK